MTLTSEQRQALEILRKEYQIIFSKDFDQENWPQVHTTVFQTVQKLGKYEYDKYATKEDSSVGSEPWKWEIKQLASTLTERAGKCVRRNEASWRFACEPLVFSRFEAQVACPKCRKRVWRSAIEATPFPDDQGAELLKRRQKKREPCCCPRSTRPQDMEEANGLSSIFIDRAQEPVIHEYELQRKLPKGEQPDRIYGLRQTRNFENLLYTVYEENKLVRDVVKSSPLSEEGHPLLLPFLLVEAKSSKSVDDWHSIKLQTTFPIYTFLEIQHSLRLATGQRSKWKVEPLVWFFMSKGEDWILCAAFRKDCASHRETGVSPETHIVELWRGCIESRDSALQLLLIVDHICDWARDIYRPAALNEFKTLSSPSTCKIEPTYTDSDIFSSRELYSIPSIDEKITRNEQEQNREKAAVYELDSPNGMVRHASFIESQFYALFITRDNVNTLLQSTQEKEVACFCRAESISSGFHLAQGDFYCVITFTSYMNVFWEQVRELCIIAVAKDAFDALVVASNLRPGRGKTRPPETLEISKNRVVTAISHLRHGSVGQNLLAAITRVAIRIDGPGFLDKRRPHYCPDEAATWQVVHYVYKSFKKGSLEPTEPFLRVSKRMDKQTFSSLRTGPSILKEELSISASKAVLIYGESHPWDESRCQQSSLCVYLLNESLDVPNRDELAAIIKETFQDHDVYHTTRNNGRYNLKPLSDMRVPWNLKHSYGVHVPHAGSSFPKWLQSLNTSLPERQESPRYSSNSGTYLLDREYYPWQDLRLLNFSGGPASYKQTGYVQRLVASEYVFWREIAYKRYEEGVQCCACCAEYLHETTFVRQVCEKCVDEIDQPSHPRWFRDELKKGLKIRFARLRGIHMKEEPMEFDIATFEASPKLDAGQTSSSETGSSEYYLTSDTSSSSDGTDEYTPTTVPKTSKRSAMAGRSQRIAPTKPSKRRRRSGNENMRLTRDD